MILELDVSVDGDDYKVQVDMVPGTGHFCVDAVQYEGVTLPMDILSSSFTDKLDKAVLNKLGEGND